MELIQSINSPKIKIHHSIWDDSLKKGGTILAVEADKALAHISPDSGWVFYLQADKVVHENDLPIIVKAAEQYLKNNKMEGLIFKYLHFYGTCDYIGDSRHWYDYEIRPIKNLKRIYSYLDRQGFRKGKDIKLNVKVPMHISMIMDGFATPIKN